MNLTLTFNVRDSAIAFVDAASAGDGWNTISIQHTGDGWQITIS
jgi:hypothetical protein